MLRDFLWIGSAHQSRARVRWANCCVQKHRGGLNLIDPEDALQALLDKWIMKALAPGSSII
jgi:hypothetical protein